MSLETYPIPNESKNSTQSPKFQVKERNIKAIKRITKIGYNTKN